MTQQLTFIGGGNIALAIYGGLLDAGYPPQSITVSDPSPEQGALATAMGLTWQADNASAIKTADIVLVCVKPFAKNFSLRLKAKHWSASQRAFRPRKLRSGLVPIGSSAACPIPQRS
jgi:pyrroline-5-carboxylate reductase